MRFHAPPTFAIEQRCCAAWRFCEPWGWTGREINARLLNEIKSSRCHRHASLIIQRACRWSHNPSRSGNAQASSLHPEPMTCNPYTVSDQNTAASAPSVAQTINFWERERPFCVSCYPWQSQELLMQNFYLFPKFIFCFENKNKELGSSEQTFKENKFAFLWPYEERTLKVKNYFMQKCHRN